MTQPMAVPAGEGPATLTALGLSAADLAALARQGFVAAEYRNGCGPYFRLHWRRDGRQRVRYLGRDVGRAAAVRAALQELHKPLRLARRLAERLRQVRRGLRDVKQQLAAHLAGRDVHYHGYTLRRSGQRHGRVDTSRAEAEAPAAEGGPSAALMDSGPDLVPKDGGMTHGRENPSERP